MSFCSSSVETLSFVVILSFSSRLWHPPSSIMSSSTRISHQGKILQLQKLMKLSSYLGVLLQNCCFTMSFANQHNLTRSSGEEVFIPRLLSDPIPCQLKASVIPINKSLRQTFDSVCVDSSLLPRSTIYCSIEKENVKWFVEELRGQGNLLNEGRTITKNIVYREIFRRENLSVYFIYNEVHFSPLLKNA